MPDDGIVRSLREGEYVGGALTGPIGEMAKESGLIMRRAQITPNTRLAFEASEFAKDKGLFDEFHKACYLAFWEEGVNLGQLSVLQEIGRNVGLDSQEMKQKLDMGYYTNQAQDHYQEALAIGVNGIPSFIIGRYFFSGAQPYEFFRKVASMAQENEVDNGS